jgi:hypothetical protein
MKKFKAVTLIACFLMLVVSCDKGDKVRKYTEKESPAPTPTRTHPPMAKTETPAPGADNAPGADAAAAHAHFQWKTPDGWEEGEKTSGFRLASFTVKAPGSTGQAVCTIIPLQGEAGGLKANVTRWLGQIVTDMGPTDARIDELLDAQQKFLAGGRLPAVFVDLTTVTPNPTDKSILATVVTVSGNSVFIKMTGEKSILTANKEKFRDLCQSFTSASAAAPH